MGDRRRRHKSLAIGITMMLGELIQVGPEQFRDGAMHISELVGLARDARKFSGKRGLGPWGTVGI